MRHGLESFLVFVVLSGSGTFYYGDDEWSLATGDCVFVDCRKRHGHETMQEDPWTLSWCHFNGGSLPGIYDKYVERGGRPVFHPEEVTEFRQLIGDIFLLASGKDYIRDMRMNEKLGILLTKIMEYSWPEDERLEKGKKSVLESVRGYLDEHFQERVLLDDLAEQFFVNKYYLTRIFKEQYGVSISSYLQNLRISQAKKMLRFTDMSLEQIGAECGLATGYYFSRVFKAVEGMAPSEYRKKW